MNKSLVRFREALCTESTQVEDRLESDEATVAQRAQCNSERTERQGLAWKGHWPRSAQEEQERRSLQPRQRETSGALVFLAKLGRRNALPAHSVRREERHFSLLPQNRATQRRDSRSRAGAACPRGGSARTVAAAAGTRQSRSFVGGGRRCARARGGPRY